MFGLELWFVLALVSTISGGLASFVYKVAAVKNYDASILAVYGSLVSSAVVLIGFVYVGDWSDLWHPMLVFAFLGAATFFMTQVLKIESLKLIDTAIFFPLYKVFGPLIAISIGVGLFAESFSQLQWIGLVFSLCVPLLLLTKSEHVRQNNLIKGCWMVLLCAVISAISIAVMKEGTSVADNIWAYIVAGEVFTGISAFMLLAYKQKQHAWSAVKQQASSGVLTSAFVIGCMHALGAYTLVFAFVDGGPLGIVYTINSLYILIPIILSIIFYSEHWNARKVIAIILSIAAVGLLG